MLPPLEFVRYIAATTAIVFSGALVPFAALLWVINYGRLFLWMYRFVTPILTLGMLWYSADYTMQHLLLAKTFIENLHPMIWTGSFAVAYLIFWAVTTFFHIGPPKWFLFIGEIQLQTTLKRRLEHGYGDAWIEKYRRRSIERRDWAIEKLGMRRTGQSSMRRTQNRPSGHMNHQKWDLNKMEELVRGNNRRTQVRYRDVDEQSSTPPVPDEDSYINGRVAWKPLGKQFRKSPNALNQVFGMDRVIEEVTENISMLLNNMNLVREYDASMSAGILLYGPPGTGKTHLARAIAEYMGLYFISVRPSDLMGTLVGATQQNIASLFKEARDHAPAIIFIDEIDSIGAKRGSSHMYHDQILTQLLMELDGFDRRDRVFVLAATNRLEMLDEALIRDGRFGTQFYVPNPDQRAIAQMFTTWGSLLHFGEGVYPIEIAMYLDGQSGATIKALIERLKRIEIRKRINKDPNPVVTREEVFAELERIGATTPKLMTEH